MQNPIRLKLTAQEAEILIGALLEQPSSERHRLADKIQTEMEYAELNMMSARAFLDSHSRLHIEEARE